MALTPGGLPYPVGTDKVVDGDDAIKALAIAVDTRPYAMGYLGTSVTVAAGAPYQIGVTGVSGLTTELGGGVTYTGGTGRFTVPTAGRYRLTCGVHYDQNISGANRLAWLALAGTATRLADWAFPGAVASHKWVGGTRTVRLAAGDGVTFFTFHDAAGPLNIVGDAALGAATFMEIFWEGV